MLDQIPLSNAPQSAFLAIFGYPWHFITKETDPRSTWQTETRYPIKPANLWHLWKSEDTLIGVRFGEKTTYSVLDIDVESEYHPSNSPENFRSILQSLESCGIYRTLIVRSSESGGIHIYLPLPDPVPTHKLAVALAHCLELDGFTIAPGKLEIFPNVKTYRPDRPSNYHGHRLPLQKGSYLLNASGDIVTNDINYFLNAFELAANGNDLNELYNAIDNAENERKITVNKHKIKSLGSRAKRWKEDCERVLEQGWTANHQTNEILGVIAQYGRVFKALAGEALVNFIHATATTANGYLQWCRHQPDILERCREWANSAQKYYTPYGEGQRKQGNPWKGERKTNAHNQGQSDEAIGRIQEAIDMIRAQVGTMITSVRALLTAIAQTAKCSIATLYKHRKLWVDLLGCNGQNALVEDVPEVEPKATENDAESLEPAPCGLLHPNSVYEGGAIAIADELAFFRAENIIYPTQPPRRDPPSDRDRPPAPPGSDSIDGSQWPPPE